MALWVACDHGKKTRIIVKDFLVSSGLQRYNHATWKEVEKLSMWRRGRMIANFSQKPHCPNLITLLIRDTEIKVFPTEVFVFPSTIRVLDLSSNLGIRSLPSSIRNFVNLEHLNLSYTDIRKLPEELKNLKKLKFLLLDGLSFLLFPKEVISSLLSLQSFRMKKSRFGVIDENDEVLLHELEGLDNLQDTRICVSSISCVKKILISSKLQMCMCELFVKGSSQQIHDLFSSLGKMEHLETLQVVGHKGAGDFGAENIPRTSFWEHELILRKLILKRCPNIIDLNWLMHAPNLELLELVECHSLVEVISEDFGAADTEIVKSNLFSSLTYLYLDSLENLRSICRMALQFPCLKEIRVKECPNLKKLPFNSQSALNNLWRFRGEPKWVTQLQWEDEATKHLLSSKFIYL